MHNPIGEPQEGDTRTYMNHKNEEVRQVYKCKKRIPGMETSILCGRNQHGCISLNRFDKQCKRRELVWKRKL